MSAPNQEDNQRRSIPPTPPNNAKIYKSAGVSCDIVRLAPVQANTALFIMKSGVRNTIKPWNNLFSNKVGSPTF